MCEIEVFFKMYMCEIEVVISDFIYIYIYIYVCQGFQESIMLRKMVCLCGGGGGFES
jgi:hypothetical protein